MKISHEKFIKKMLPEVKATFDVAYVCYSTEGNNYYNSEIRKFRDLHQETTSLGFLMPVEDTNR